MVLECLLNTRLIFQVQTWEVEDAALLGGCSGTLWDARIWDAEGEYSWSPFCVLCCWDRVGAGAGGSPRTAESCGSTEGTARGAGEEVFISVD